MKPDDKSLKKFLLFKLYISAYMYLDHCDILELLSQHALLHQG